MAACEPVSKLLPVWKHQLLSNECSPRLTSLGLAVIDTIKFGNGHVVHDILGGSGIYCSVGALMFSNDAPHLIAFKILAGFDFPEVLESDLQAWHIDLTIQKETKWQSVRGLLEYKDTTFGPKKFQYTTPVLQVEAKDINSSAAILASAFHFLSHPGKVKDVVDEITLYRGARQRPLIVWEPAPPTCTVEHFDTCLRATQAIDVFSPNHLELLKLCNKDQQAWSKSTIEECTTMFLEAGIGPHRTGMAIIRAGEHGCMIKTSIGLPAIWLPPYYTSEEKEKIVDTTGAGNAFLGGFIRGYQETGCAVEAACYGSVAASYMLEQIGTPTVTKSEDGTAYWNGENPRRRLITFKLRCQLG